MRLPQGFEWLIIAAIILLLFGAKRMPDAARGLGRSLRIFKAETKGLNDDDAAPPPPTPSPAPPAPSIEPAPPASAVPPPPGATPSQDAPAPERTEG